jgi:hypothetical protein
MSKELESMIKRPIMTGLLTSLLVLSSLSIKFGFDYGRFLIDKSRIPLAQPIKTNIQERFEYVGMGVKRLKPRNEMLYTDSLGSCIGLVIDDKISKKHYLEHLMVPYREEVIHSITNNFSNLKNLEIFIIEGICKNNRGINEVVKAIRSLNLLNQTKYTSSREIAIKEGVLYLPTNNIIL